MLVATDLVKTYVVERNLFGRARKSITAVDGVSLDVAEGHTLAIVGESGCGKSTTAEMILMLQKPDQGAVVIDSQDLTTASRSALRQARLHLQVVFQDPYASLDPSQKIGSTLAEPLVIHRIGDRSEHKDRVRQILTQVGLPATDDILDRYPGQFSGGQRQRLAIARALIVNPRYVVLDEAVSALDVSTQAQVLTLLRELQDKRGLAYLFISHDLGVVRQMASEIAVMYLGRVVERGDAAQIYAQPRHPYTADLLRAVPVADPRQQRAHRKQMISGEPPDPAHRPVGCAYHPRCPFAKDLCKEQTPELRSLGGQQVACHFAEDLTLTGAPISPTAATDATI